jgi:hypothetical protein
MLIAFIYRRKNNMLRIGIQLQVNTSSGSISGMLQSVCASPVAAARLYSLVPSLTARSIAAFFRLCNFTYRHFFIVEELLDRKLLFN